MENFITEHGGVLLSGIVAIMTIIIMFLIIRAMGNLDLESMSMLLG